jgi:hypothetical protein
MLILLEVGRNSQSHFINLELQEFGAKHASLMPETGK